MQMIIKEMDMPETFELFRLSLLEKDPHNDLLAKELWQLSRKEWLEKVFSEEVSLNSYGSEFHYVPAPEHSDKKVLLGRVGRHVSRAENKPPEEGLEEFIHDTWLASLIVLDPTHHEDGQKLAIQSNSHVGAPSSLMKNMIGAINEKYAYGPYHIEIGQIFETQSFWSYVGENKGNVTSVTFDLVAPNMFGGSDDWDNDIRALRDDEKIQKMQLSLKSDDGLELETERIRQAVNYAEKTSGKIRASAKDKPSYNSTDVTKKTRIDDIKDDGIELMNVAARLAARILGRE